MEPTVPPVELKHATVERLMHYYHFISEQVETSGTETVTSGEIAKLVRMDDTLVRKDLAAIGVRGLPRVGFRCAAVVNAIHDVLGFGRKYRGVIIGVGRMGSAMASYKGFAKYGLEVCALFDLDPFKMGLVGGGNEILPLSKLPEVVRDQDVSVAILTVPAEAAQEVADAAVAAGVKALWNFASTSLSVPDGVFVRHEHISVGLAELSYLLKQSSDTA
ncbi:MAG: redox-sensing transcriptional repressor Rex [bacterium]|nr:redox-sensing transcriptional repressor Rex [bacterium]